jgi:hypothetical protein
MAGSGATPGTEFPTAAGKELQLVAFPDGPHLAFGDWAFDAQTGHFNAIFGIAPGDPRARLLWGHDVTFPMGGGYIVWYDDPFVGNDLQMFTGHITLVPLGVAWLGVGWTFVPFH